MGGLRGAPPAPEFGGFEAAGFVTLCEGSALGATALRTDTAGPPGQPERLSLPGLSWVFEDCDFLAASWAWVYGVQPFSFAAAWASAVGNP